jgi:UDP-N-acetylglucosamine 3-dehydrogenase
MKLHRVLADPEAVGHLFVGKSLGEELQNLQFAGGHLFDGWRLAAAGWNHDRCQGGVEHQQAARGPLQSRDQAATLRVARQHAAGARGQDISDVHLTSDQGDHRRGGGVHPNHLVKGAGGFRAEVPHDHIGIGSREGVRKVGTRGLLTHDDNRGLLVIQQRRQPGADQRIVRDNEDTRWSHGSTSTRSSRALFRRIVQRNPEFQHEQGAIVQAPIRIGVIGIGAIATRSHIPEIAALTDARIEAVASRRTETARAVAAKYEIPSVYDGEEGWHALIASPAIDAVLICSPSALHAEMAIAAGRAGKHLLIEKPLATTVADGRRVLDAVQQAGISCFVAHHRRLKPVYREGRTLLASQVIGEVYRVEATLGHGGPEAWAPGAAWFFDPERAGGGAVLDLGIHMVDTVLWLLGRLPDAVMGSVSTVEKPTKLEDQGIAILRFGSGCLATVTVSWAMRPGARRVEAFGSRGRLIMDEGAEDGVILDQVKPEPVQQRFRFPPSALNAAGFPSNGVGPAFVESLRSGTSKIATGEEGLQALAVVEAWYRSAATAALCPLKTVL